MGTAKLKEDMFGINRPLRLTEILRPALEILNF